MSIRTNVARRFTLAAACCLGVAPAFCAAQSTTFSAPDLRPSTTNSISSATQTKNLDQTLSQIADAEQALRTRPGSAKDNLSLGLALKSVGEGGAAAKFFERALALDSDLAEAWYQKSIIEADQEQWTTAAAGFRRAVVLEPNHVLAHIALGEMWLRLGDFEQAATEFSTASRLESGNASPHYGLGLVRLQQGNIALSEGEFRQALALRPSFVLAEEALGRVLVSEHKWSEAVMLLEKVITANPNSLEATNALATALSNLGEKTRAAVEFQKARELSRQELLLHRAQGDYNRGLVLWYSGKLQEAAAVFRSAIETKTNYAQAHNTLGGVLWQMNEAASALAEFQAAVRYDPDFAEAHNNWGTVLVHTGNLDQAIEQFHAALGSRPGFALARLNLGRALASKRDLVGAEAELRRAVSLAPEMAAAHVELGMALAAKATPSSADAKAELKEGLRLDPKLRTSIPIQYLQNLN